MTLPAAPVYMICRRRPGWAWRRGGQMQGYDWRSWCWCYSPWRAAAIRAARVTAGTLLASGAIGFLLWALVRQTIH